MITSVGLVVYTIFGDIMWNVVCPQLNVMRLNNVMHFYPEFLLPFDVCKSKCDE